jgi:CRISPR/Cas system-associated exonuclease Cas4 (RecB family)
MNFMADFKKNKRSADWNYGGAKWRLSRSKIDLFAECPRCFYIDNKLGVARPRGPAFTLNVAVDELLKKEFDIHRAEQTAHPLLKKYGLDAVPFSHPKLGVWREQFKGLEFVHPPTGFTVSGAIDDVWVNKGGALIVVDYKATAKEGRIESLSDTKWERQYKRQIEIYQWLLRQMGFTVSDTGYFVYVNGKKDRVAFDGRLEFEVTLVPHKGIDSWVEKTLLEIKKCLDGGKLPPAGSECDFCAYRKSVGEVLEEVASPKVPKVTSKKDLKDESASSSGTLF